TRFSRDWSSDVCSSDLSIQTDSGTSNTMRTADVIRNTNDTRIRVSINLDGTGKQTIQSGMPFLDHMLDQIARHGLIDLDIHCDRSEERRVGKECKTRRA